MTNNVAILKCDCAHLYQDGKYGKGMRVCNPTKKGKEVIATYRCTVCAKEHQS